MNKGRMSLKFRYLLSSFSVAFIAFAVFGLVLFYVSVRSFEMANRRQAEHKLGTLARNIEEQITDMERMSFIIQGRTHFNWSILSRNRYNDITLLAELNRFSAGFQIVDNYFLLYVGDRRVYRASAAMDGFTNEFDFFVQSAGIDVCPAEFYHIVTSVTEMTVIPVKVNGLQTIIIAYPVFTMGRASDAGRATLGFILCNQLLYSYARLLVGDFMGDIQLSFGNATMSIPGNSTSITESYNMVMATAYTDKLVVSMGFPGVAGLAIFEIINAIYIILAALLVFAVAALWGYTNYRPIQKLLRKYAVHRKHNEIENIEKFFDSIISEKETNELKRQEQYGIIKKQTLSLMMSGDTRYHALMTKPLMELEFSGALFMIIALKPNMKYSEEEIESLTVLIEQLFCEWATYYLVPVASYYAVIVNILTEEYCEAAFEKLKDTVNKNYNFCMMASETVDNITLLCDAYNKLFQQQEKRAEVLLTSSHNEIVKYIYENYSDHDMCLDKLSQHFDLSNRYISNIVKEETGLTYVELMTGIRIKKAAQLLREGSLSIAETCLAVGYAHMPHFTKTFKRITGYTPSGYVKYIKEHDKED